MDSEENLILKPVLIYLRGEITELALGKEPSGLLRQIHFARPTDDTTSPPGRQVEP